MSPRAPVVSDLRTHCLNPTPWMHVPLCLPLQATQGAGRGRVCGPPSHGGRTQGLPATSTRSPTLHLHLRLILVPPGTPLGGLALCPRFSLSLTHTRPFFLSNSLFSASQVYVRPFMEAFPKAKLYVAPGQFSWPLDLPFGCKIDGVLTDDFQAPFRKEVDYTGWSFKPFVGSISEVAFFHRASKTLLVRRRSQG